MDAPPVQYLTTSDGYNIAYAVSGQGPPLVFMPAAIHHIELAWSSESLTLPWLQRLADRFQLIQFDGRGQGLSTRNLPESTSMDDLLRDLTAVIDQLAPGPMVFVGHGATSHVFVNYAALNRDRVAALVFIACSAANSSWPAALWKELAGDNWENFVLSTRGVSGYQIRSREQLERMRQTITQSDWLIREHAYRDSDVSDLLQRLRIPTLVLQPRLYFGLPHEESMRLAALTPGSRFVLIDGETPFGDAEQGIAAMDAFLTALSPERSSGANAEEHKSLSTRERQVLRAISRGLSNQQIADELVISVRTVERHINHIYEKLGVHNKAQATAYALSRSVLAP
jgi:pimeloyl-ACP methyl ester carboxylesterase/DNA-binding CsgD family transcriptional regulator